MFRWKESNRSIRKCLIMILHSFDGCQEQFLAFFAETLSNKK